VSQADTPPIACTLDSSEVPERIARWAELARHVTERTAIPDGVRVRFDRTVTPALVTDLAADELACCGFLTFSIRLAPGTITLDVLAPDEARDLLDVLLPPVAVEG
jgi:hypothetical protein